MITGGLRAFIAAAEAGSFTRAADVLLISAAAAVKRVNALEDRLGLKLFVRTNQGLELTPAGAALLPRAKKLVREADEAIASAKAALSCESRTFSLGSSLLNPGRPFTDLWERVSPRFPGWDLRIVPFDDRREGILSVIGALGSQYDFICGPCDALEWLNRCNFLPAGTAKFQVAVPKSHPLADRPIITFEDLRGLTVTVPAAGTSPRNDRLRRRLEAHGVRTACTTPYYDMEVFNRAAAAGEILLTLECWKDVSPLLRTIPCEWEDGIRFGILYEFNPRPGVLQIISAFREILSENPSA